jgi:GTP-binding protein EngB required for normal cell division
VIAERNDNQLVLTYERIRRREYELISSLLEVLPRIDGLDEERIAQIRDALFHADHPFLLVFIGPFSAGKSSLINAVVGQPDLLPVGPTPTTDKIVILRHAEQTQRLRVGETETVFSPSPLLQKVSMVDTPGLESIFQQHEAITRKFLHRADAVLLVMLATQAMTARNLDYLRILREYGKTVIIIINQIDLLTAEEAATVRQYVLDQSRDLLGYQPEVWMMSARLGIEARQPDGLLNPELWERSGLGRLEQYVDEQLSDEVRLRQKLQTPIQIVQSVQEAALAAVRANQAAIDQYRGIAQNVQQQLDAYKREQERTVREHLDEVTAKFAQTGARGREAIRGIFQPVHLLRLMVSGFGELFGLAGIVRRARRSTLYVAPAFEQARVFEPLDQLPDGVEKLAPRLEGKDIEDTEALVAYARRELDALPPTIRAKAIGTMQPPQRYDRSALQQVRSELDAIEGTVRRAEVERTEASIRSALISAAAWLAIALIVLVFVAAAGLESADGTPLNIILIPALIVLALLAFVFLVVRGRGIGSEYERRVIAHGQRYTDALARAADRQVAYGMQLRRDAVAPLTRLIEAQTTMQSEQLTALHQAQQDITRIEAELTRLAVS